MNGAKVVQGGGKIPRFAFVYGRAIVTHLALKSFIGVISWTSCNCKRSSRDIKTSRDVLRSLRQCSSRLFFEETISFMSRFESKMSLPASHRARVNFDCGSCNDFSFYLQICQSTRDVGSLSKMRDLNVFLNVFFFFNYVCTKVKLPFWFKMLLYFAR